MIPVAFSFVPPGGGEADYGMETELESVPQAGDYILIQKEDESGYSTFIVRRSWWYLKSVKGKGKLRGVTVECEFAQHEGMSDEHKRSCEMYAHRKGKIQQLDSSTY
jgi:hypothetical protein